jgi:hypothetical protein
MRRRQQPEPAPSAAYIRDLAERLHEHPRDATRHESDELEDLLGEHRGQMLAYRVAKTPSMNVDEIVELILRDGADMRRRVATLTRSWPTPCGTCPDD